MRAIKFRAWDKDNERMLELHELRLNTDKDGVVFFSDSTPPFNTHGDVELQQYTGLKDKNGKEIYEGDVIAYKGYKQTVKFVRGCFVSDGLQLKIPIRLGGLKNVDLEVIGNIYENPELLK